MIIACYYAPAVAKAAMDTGVARQSIDDMEKYINSLKSRIDPTLTAMEGIFNSIKENKKTVIFSNGTNNRVIVPLLSKIWVMVNLY